LSKKESAPTLSRATTVQDMIIHFNMGALDTVTAPQDPQAGLLKYIHSQLAIQSALDVQEQLEDKKEERKLEKEARRLRLQKELKDLQGSSFSDPATKTKIANIISDPTWVAQFKDLDYDDKELLLTAMMSSASEGRSDSMVPLLMMLSKQQGVQRLSASRTSSISSTS